MCTDTNKDLVRRFYDRLSDGNLDGALDLWVAEPVFHLPGMGDVRGKEAVRRMAGQFFAAFPDLSDTVEDVIAEGDQVAARITSRGTHLGPFMGIPATGRSFSIGGITVFRIMDDRIAEEWDQSDFLGLLQQLGAIPPPA